MEYRAGTPIYAFVVALVSGALLATGHYIGGGIAGVLATVVFALWKFAEQRGDDDRHTMW